MKQIRLLLILSVALCGAAAMAYDEPAVNLGFTSFVDGAPPAGPGFYFQEYFQWYYTDKFLDKDGDKFLPVDPNLGVFVSLSQFLYQSNQKLLLGGKWGMDVIVPLVYFDLESNGLPLTENNGAIGDVLVGPYLQWDPVMGKNGPVFMHRIEFQCILPSGAYNKNDTLNPGSNFFSFDPYWAATWFPTPKCSLSWRFHYLWNAENTDPAAPAKNTQAGQAIHLNFATSYELIAKRVRFGLNGYYLKQVTDSDVDGSSVSGREQVLGLGPGLLYSFSQNDHLFCNLYFETAVQNRTEGTRAILRWTHHF